MTEYKIVSKEAFTVAGLSRKFSQKDCYEMIPLFWNEYMSSSDRRLKGMYGVCIDGEGDSLEYLIADEYHAGSDIPEGCVTYDIPKGTWAVFPCRGKLPEALQEVNTYVWKKWLPDNGEYTLAGDCSLEVYTENMEYSEIWVPVSPCK